MNIKNGDYIRITKVKSLNDISENNTYTQTLLNEPWWCEGYLNTEIKLDEKLRVLRLRNYNYPSGKLGIFETTEILSYQLIDNQYIINTQNSIYCLEKVNSPKTQADKLIFSEKS